MALPRLIRLAWSTWLPLLVAATVLVAVLPAERGAAASACMPYGVVLDSVGQPVVGIHLRLWRGTELLNTATDTDGRYDFRDSEFVRLGLGVSYQVLELLPEDHSGVAPRFQVLYRQQVPSMQVLLNPQSPDCPQDFDFSGEIDGATSEPAEADWPSLIELYRRTERAWRLFDELGIAEDAPRPIRIYGWCDDPAIGCPESVPGLPSDFAAFMVGYGDGPQIVLGESTSLLSDWNAPDNREYHELGHLAHYLITDGWIPVDPDNTNHGGYYVNPSSTDSWVEGFASFFSIMIAKHVDDDPAAERFRLYGADYDLEVDHRAWEWLGWWEEMALSGVLLDIEDGDADYRRRSLAPDIEVIDRRIVDLGGMLGVAGEVVNDSDEVIHGAEVTVELLDSAGEVIYRTATPVLEPALAPGEQAEFVAPVPHYMSFHSTRVTPGPMHVSDDDPVNETLEDLVAVLRTYESAHPLAAGQVFDAVDLHAALSEAFGGRDRDGDGRDDIDQIFIEHGFFADLEGLRPATMTAGAQVAFTSHPEIEGYSAMIPRRDVPAAPEATMVIGMPDAVDVDVLVHVAPSTGRSYGYVLRSSEAGEVTLPALSRAADATVTLVALPEGGVARVVGQMSAEGLWRQWEADPGAAVAYSSVAWEPTPPAPLESPEAASGWRTPNLALPLAIVAGLATVGAYAWVIFAAGSRR